MLPSVVTPETKAGDESEMGSGIVLTSDGLTMTNNHVVALIHAAPPASTSHVVTLCDGRTGVLARSPLIQRVISQLFVRRGWRASSRFQSAAQPACASVSRWRRSDRRWVCRTP